MLVTEALQLSEALLELRGIPMTHVLWGELDWDEVWNRTGPFHQAFVIVDRQQGIIYRLSGSGIGPWNRTPFIYFSPDAAASL